MKLTQEERDLIDYCKGDPEIPNTEIPEWIDHFKSGSHRFLDSWNVALVLQDDQQFRCNSCYLNPWEVSNFTFDSLSYLCLSDQENELIRSSANDRHELVTALRHLGEPEHIWVDGDSEWALGNPVCQICDMRTDEVTNLGDLDVLQGFRYFLELSDENPLGTDFDEEWDPNY